MHPPQYIRQIIQCPPAATHVTAMTHQTKPMSCTEGHWIHTSKAKSPQTTKFKASRTSTERIHRLDNIVSFPPVDADDGAVNMCCVESISYSYEPSARYPWSHLATGPRAFHWLNTAVCNLEKRAIYICFLTSFGAVKGQGINRIFLQHLTCSWQHSCSQSLPVSK